ncbi:CopD family protein [Parvularcula sp. ZS-1/3]|uniref:Protoporphyrinogen IX oxidase n=1 Tax=Parvularcula mediterranea TaxID=2732508 RepID=A0A7Y3RLD8_9PROT|nr:CopD family protein [Parvularcula mediterranea]NNU15735.1 CopD family protein [Parvularcula mediterranea]
MEWLAPFYNWLKALHIIAVVAWMVGMLYLPRLFVYQFAAEKGGEGERILINAQKLLLRRILNPAMIATWVFGLLLIAAAPEWANDGWFIVKFAAVIALSGLHGFFSASRKKFAMGERPRTEKFWRVINEAPFGLLAIIVFMVILKPFVW